MPGMDGVTAITELARRGVAAHVLVLTTYDTDSHVLQAIEAGATGYLLKDAPRDELLRAVRAAARGESSLSPAVAARLMNRVRSPGAGPLSQREIQVLVPGRPAAGSIAENDAMGQELAVTRRSLHGVAELVLAGPQYRATGKLRLGVVPGGFATTTLTPGLRVDGSRVAGADGVTAAIGGRTPRALGAELGVAAGRPEGVYDGGSGVDPDETLALDPEQAGVIVGALVLGHDALVAFAPGETPVLWPEHFDVAIRVQDVNFGVSPGDGFIEEPYAYVGVSSPPAGDKFWNAPFGAAVPLRELPGASAVTGFFAEGRERARLAPVGADEHGVVDRTAGDGVTRFSRSVVSQVPCVTCASPVP
jgi:hypothetical protein